GGGGAPGRIAEAGFARDIGEAALRGVLRIGRLIMIENHAAPAGDEQIWPAVVVVIGDGAAVRVKEGLVESDFGGNVLELPVAEVFVKFGGMAANVLFFVAGEIAAAGDEDVNKAVAVEIEEGDAAAERFEDGVVA